MSRKIKCIVESLNPTDPAIIFFHGLDGHATQTWMLNPNDENTLWPKWLASDFKCSVYLVAYDAALSRWKDSAMPLPDQGNSILEELCSEPQLKNRPLILVGHSMGGLVIKTVINNGLTMGVERHKKIIEQVRGVVFVGTPHKGAQLASLARLMSFVLRTNTQVKNMQNHDGHLRSLNQQFLAYYGNPPSGKVSVLTFAETQGVFIGKKVMGIRVGPTVTIVDPDSGNPHVPGEVAIPLAADHISMCKLEDKHEPLYKSLLRFLTEDVDLSIAETPPEVESLLETLETETLDSIKVAEGGNTINMSAGEKSIVVKEFHGTINMDNR